MNELMKCGCGGEARVGIVYPDGICFYRVYCEKCRTQTDIQDTAAEAIEAWNKAMGAKNVNISDQETVIIEPFTTDMNHVGYCKCGYLVNAEWKYCPSCGARLEWG